MDPTLPSDPREPDPTFPSDSTSPSSYPREPPYSVNLTYNEVLRLYSSMPVERREDAVSLRHTYPSGGTGGSTSFQTSSESHPRRTSYSETLERYNSGAGISTSGRVCEGRTSQYSDMQPTYLPSPFPSSYGSSSTAASHFPSDPSPPYYEDPPNYVPSHSQGHPTPLQIPSVHLSSHKPTHHGPPPSYYDLFPEKMPERKNYKKNTLRDMRK